MSEGLFDTMSASPEVKIRVVSLIAPKLKKNKMTDITFELFMYDLCLLIFWFVFVITVFLYQYLTFRLMAKQPRIAPGN